MSEKTPNSANIGLNLDSISSQIKQGELSYALNAVVEGFDGKAVTYQNEQSNEYCLQFPEGYVVIGKKESIEFDVTIFWLANPSIRGSEIGKVVGKSCIYQTVINAPCLNLDINFPILKAEIRRLNNNIQVFWPDNRNNRRWLDFGRLPYKRILNPNNCEEIITTEIDCNQLNVQPNFSIPQLAVVSADSDGELIEGTYQFAAQYADAAGNGYTSFFSVTNPISIFDPLKVSLDFNLPTNKSVHLKATDIDITGVYEYVNIAVIETINNITTPYLMGTFKIESDTISLSYTGANKTQIKLSIEDIFEKFPVYNKADDVTAVDDILVWKGLTIDDEINFQKIANKITLQWETYRLPAADKDDYSQSINTANTEGYMGDEIYPFGIVPLLAGGVQLHEFPIPGRAARPSDLAVIYNRDSIDDTGSVCDSPSTGLPRWKVYNTASVVGNLYPQCTNGSGGSQGPIAATFQFVCSDNGCTEQGEIGLNLTFSRPLPESTTLQFGVIFHNTGPNTNNGVGYDIYSLPSDTTPMAVYDPNEHLPFQVIVPAGTTSISFPQPIYLQGLSGAGDAWICHNCLFPMRDVYIRPISPSNTQINFSTTQGITIHNIFTPSTPPPPPPNTGTCLDQCYAGPWQYGDFAYWESTELYPCNEDIWGDLSGQPIRHHKFPDSTVAHIHDKDGNIYPKGVRIDIDQIKQLIATSDLSDDIKSRIVGFKIVRGNRASNKSVIAKGLVNNVGIYTRETQSYFYPNYPFNDLRADPFISTVQTTNDSGNVSDLRLKGFETDDSKKRYTLHSPDTSFYQPFLGTQLKLETAEFGKSQGHFAEVLNHSKYKVLSFSAYTFALSAAVVIGLASSTLGLSDNIFNGSAAFTAFQVIIDIIDKLVPRKNYAYQFNSTGQYTDFKIVPNDLGQKIRFADIATYLVPGMTTAGDTLIVNNFQRESSVYLRTTDTLPFPQDFGVPEDQSRFIASDENTCGDVTQVINKDISSFYASLKRPILDQYGPINSYEIVDTGFNQLIDSAFSQTVYGKAVVFGGDTFINKFAYKSKVPFFIDNRVAPNNTPPIDDADVFYNELDNLGYPIFWFSTDSQSGASSGGGLVKAVVSAIEQFLGVKVNNLDCKGSQFFYQTGKFYLFAYGIPYFFCESDVNVDFRQATNDKEGDFYPHVGNGIPDNWLQEKQTSIQQDNTYIYNKTFSKQNKENVFTTLPEDYLENLTTDLSNVGVFSDKQVLSVNSRINNWLIYRPSSIYPFSMNYGKLIAIDGIENRQLLARFEKKTSIYNALLTAPTSAGEVYLGQSLFSSQVPPIDFAETDLGYTGTQNKFLLKTEYGAISVDAQRGQIFLLGGKTILGGRNLTDISSDKFKLNKFLTSNLDFVIKQYFPDVNTDNHFNGIGMHGVYDNKYDRALITKLDYQPLIDGITHLDGKFYYNENQISLNDTNYFCNKSFTLSFDFGNQAWISFHSYLPNFYVGGSNYFYTGLNRSTSTFWRHNTAMSSYNNFYGEIAPYIIEYPYSYKLEDEIMQSVSDYTKVAKYTDAIKWVLTSDVYFTKSIIYNDEQCSGILHLIPKQKNNLYQYSQYPKYNSDSKDILFTRSNNFYNYNTIYDIVVDSEQPIFQASCNSLSEDKILIPSNLDYGVRSFKKRSIMSKDCKIRHILDDRSDRRFISQFIVTETQKSFK